MVSEIFNGECYAMVDIASKQRSRSFFLVSIDISYTTYQAANNNFCSRTHRLATIHNVTDDIRTQYCSISATVSAVG